tara:strand:- start:267 stop:1322 length:1056 start_codon:yes stop_codon:yes gene_type:complete
MDKIKHNKVSLKQQELYRCLKVVQSGNWAQGKEVKKLESRLRLLSGQNHLLAVNNGLNALIIALKSLGIKKGDKVMIPAYSCVALANSVLACGADYICVDVDEKKYNMNFYDAKKKFNDKVKAIIIVNMFGLPAIFSKFKELNVPIIEDCAHGFGLEIEGNLMGGQADISIFSFYSTKFIGFGEGGAIGFKSNEHYSKALDLRDYTDKEPSADRLNYKMTDIIASVIQTKLKNIDSLIKKRENIASKYLDTLDSSFKKSVQDFPKVNKRIWYRFVLQVNDADLFISNMARSSIEVARPVEDWRGHVEAKNTPIASKLFMKNISIPMYLGLTNNEQKHIISLINKSKKHYVE